MDPFSGTGKRPACDNCKSRKTKCNRESPCSSCVASNLDCRMGDRAGEKRQRVLISARYDEAMENVDRSLQDVSNMLQKLLQINERPGQSSPKDPATAFLSSVHPSSSIAGMDEGYRGDSSFAAHVKRVTESLSTAASNLQLSRTDMAFSEAMSAIQALEDTAGSEENTPGFGDTDSPSSFIHVRYPELQCRTVPSLEHVLGLLRLAQTERQRIFIDVPVIDEAEFGGLCQKVYFAINEYSVMTWIIVNVGLFYLFTDLKDYKYAAVGVTHSDIQTYTQLLTDNIEATIQSMRLFQDPSVEGIQALALLTTYCLKSGRSKLGWSCVATASAMCIDLGLHQLPKDMEMSERLKKRSIFWNVYIIDKGLAFTMGRVPSIQPYDVSTERPAIHDKPGIPGHLYAGFFEYALIVGELQTDLFSVAARQQPQQIQIEKAKAFATRLIGINTNLKQSLEQNPVTDKMFASADIILDIMMHCLVTIVYRIIPCNEPNASPLQCNSICVEAARHALSTIVNAYEGFGHSPEGWVRLLNMLLSLVPLAPFVVLTGHTVASSSAEDLGLLAATVTALKPISSRSISGKKLYDVCKTFHQFATVFVAQQMTVPQAQFHPSVSAPPTFNPQTEGGLSMSLGDAGPSLYTMAPQDWDVFMGEFDMGTGAGAMASFLEPYMPFDQLP
ncbi:hypothetical protein MW887_000797 [Aspergillus wentii]|nr:hypothetical protein MW887_000797 [Aspergillus wentii]